MSPFSLTTNFIGGRCVPRVVSNLDQLGRLIMRINGQKKLLGTAAALAVTVPFVLAGAAPATAATTVSCGKSVANVNAVVYADRLVRAWGSGEQATTSCY